MLNLVIISNELTVVEEEELVKVLREHKSGIGWQIDDLQGISPTMCMHKIDLEKDFKHICQLQRRLNPTMKDMVRKEVIKLLDACVIIQFLIMSGRVWFMWCPRKVG